MLTESVVTIWVVVSLAYLLRPVLADDPTALWDSGWWLSADDGPTDDTREAAGRAITDGGQVCQNCGAAIDSDFTYCGECVTAVV